MTIQVALNGSEVQFAKELVRNILTIKIPFNESGNIETKKYGICLNSPQ
jgi:hypothetical protein